MTTSYSDIKSFPHSNAIWKKVVCVGGKSPAMVVVLQESIVNELAIDRESWLEQIPMRDGVFLRVSHAAPATATREINGINGQDDHEEWSSACISDRLYREMCGTNKLAVIYEGQNNEQKINWYYAEAATYARRTSAGNFAGKNAKYKPVFHLDQRDFSHEVRANLAERLKTSKESLHRVIEDAVFMIFRARHPMIFYQHIEAEGLRWRCV
jgi:hypothetical protein